MTTTDWRDSNRYLAWLSLRVCRLSNHAAHLLDSPHPRAFNPHCIHPRSSNDTRQRLWLLRLGGGGGGGGGWLHMRHISTCICVVSSHLDIWKMSRIFSFAVISTLIFRTTIHMSPTELETGCYAYYQLLGGWNAALGARNKQSRSLLSSMEPTDNWRFYWNLSPFILAWGCVEKKNSSCPWTVCGWLLLGHTLTSPHETLADKSQLTRSAAMS